MVCGLIALAYKLRSVMERMVCKEEAGNLVWQGIAPERAGMGIASPERRLGPEPVAPGYSGRLMQLDSGMPFCTSLESGMLYFIAQSCPTLCNPMDWSPPGSFVHGDSPGQRTGVVAMPSPRESSQPRD